METIFALATAPGRAGISVVRISGPKAHDAAMVLAGRKLPARGMTLCRLRNKADETLDQALVLTFPSPHSFTGENVAELQLHGSPAVVAAVLESLSQIQGLKPAEAGEFTRQALENSQLDLTQVEGLADLIDSETESQRRQAQEAFKGTLSNLADTWRTDLIRAASLIEATIDFVDEDVPVDVSDEVRLLLHRVLDQISKERVGVDFAERVRQGFEVAILGPPNAGKSTLLNRLAARDAAITSEHAGTTRDVIEVKMDLQGLPVTLLDTAGLRETDDAVEAIGVARARSRGAEADLRVILIEEATDPEVTPQPGDIVAIAKGDLYQGPAFAVSGRTGKGLDLLVSRIVAVLHEKTQNIGVATRLRHKQSLESCEISLGQALSLLESGPERYDLVAEEIRSSVRSLSVLIGRVDVEDLLDQIFASFCIGK